jgi:hypothetical protein
MALKTPLDWEPYRRPHWMDPNDMGDRGNGCFIFPARSSMVVVCSNGGGWEHASVSVRDRCPTWEEMEWVKRQLWSAEDTVMQLHVPPAEHRNCHPHCLHLWRPTDREIPRPPGMFVAPDEGEARVLQRL